MGNEIITVLNMDLLCCMILFR